MEQTTPGPGTAELTANGLVGGAPAAPVPDGAAAGDALAAVRAKLASPAVKVRADAISELATVGGGEALGLLAAQLSNDPSQRVRQRCVEELPRFGAAACEGLVAALSDEHNDAAVRRTAATKLGLLKAEGAVAALGQALAADASDEVRRESAFALAKIGGAPAVAALVAGAGATETAWLKGIVVNELGKLGDASAVEVVAAAAGSADESVARAGIRALFTLDPARALREAKTLLRSENPKVRARVVDGLKGSNGADALGLLARVVVGDRDPTVRGAASAAMGHLPDPGAKLDTVLGAIRSLGLARRDLDAALVVEGLLSAANDPVADLSAAILSRAATAADDATRAVLAALLVADWRNDADQAGDAINAYERDQKLAPEALQGLRFQVGGYKALDPVLRIRQSNLERYFLPVIDQLDRQTQADWTQTTRSARSAFRTRMVMSVVVFVVGIALIAVSIFLFYRGRLDTQQAFGVGGSLVGGLVSILAVVYTGPLKDIRQSASDLGNANVAFIGYVHQILEISHTFSALYLAGGLTFEQLGQSTALIGQAMRDASTILSNVSAAAAGNPPPAPVVPAPAPAVPVAPAAPAVPVALPGAGGNGG